MGWQNLRTQISSRILKLLFKNLEVSDEKNCQVESRRAVQCLLARTVTFDPDTTHPTHCYSSLTSPLTNESSPPSHCISTCSTPPAPHLPIQVAVSTDSQEALCSEGGESTEGLVNVATLSPPPTPPPRTSVPQQQQQQPALCLLPATPGASPNPWRPTSVHTQLHDLHCLSTSSSSPSPSLPPSHAPAKLQSTEDTSADQEVSLLTHTAAIVAGGGGDVTTDNDGGGSNDGYSSRSGLPERRSPSSSRQLKRFHSVDTQGRSALLPRPRPRSWLDDPRRHSLEACPPVATQPSAAASTSTSSGFVSRADSLQIQSQMAAPTSPASPRRKKKMSPPCISVDPPEGLEGPQVDIYHQALGGLAGFGMPLPLPGRDTCLRRRAPSNDSKDSFDLGVGGEGPGRDDASPNPTSKLLTPPTFPFEKTSAEH